MHHVVDERTTLWIGRFVTVTRTVDTLACDDMHLQPESFSRCASSRTVPRLNSIRREHGSSNEPKR